MTNSARTAGERYVAAVNAGDLDALVALFAPDAVLLHPLGRFEGSAAIRQFYADNVLAHGPRLAAGGWVEEGRRCVFELDASVGERTTHAIDHCTVDGDGLIVRMAIGYR